MAAFLILVVFCVIGLGVVGFLFFKDKGEENLSIRPISPEELKAGKPLAAESKPITPSLFPLKTGGGSLFAKLFPKKEKSSPGLAQSLKISTKDFKPQKGKSPSLINKLLGLLKKNKSSASNITPLPSIKDALASGSFSSKADQSNEHRLTQISPPPSSGVGTASITTKTSPPASTTPQPAKMSLSQTEELKIEKEIEMTAQIEEFREKLERSDKILREKTETLEKIQNELEGEKNHRKEFNKVKDLLEKELADTKDRSRKIQVELTSTQSENDSFKRRIDQLEEKATKLEKTLIEKEDKVDELVKRLQTFASSTTAATPPTREDTKTKQSIEENGKNTLREQQVQQQPSLPTPEIKPPEPAPETTPPAPTPTPEHDEPVDNTAADSQSFLKLRPDVLPDDAPKKDSGDQPPLRDPNQQPKE